MARKKKPPLTDREWAQVFTLRCRSKRGERLAPEEQALVERAFKEDRARYSKMDERIFSETLPFGSDAKFKR